MSLSSSEQIAACAEGRRGYKERRVKRTQAPRHIRDEEDRAVWMCEYNRGWRMANREAESKS